MSFTIQVTTDLLLILMPNLCKIKTTQLGCFYFCCMSVAYISYCLLPNLRRCLTITTAAANIPNPRPAVFVVSDPVLGNFF